ncbi:MAG: hypothetical protein DRJ10_00300 [Bacteroidetes bacterium]|nr:MAG: hypothetical protein DRJ10_00300 [Bacteroidota bacterium]
MKQLKMKNILLLLLIMPVLAISQQPEGKEPLTPYADLTFKNGIVVYSLGQNQAILNPRLLPKVYDKNLLRLHFSNDFNNVSGKYIAESQQAIRDYVNTELVTLRSDKEQKEYLKLCALLVLWDRQLSQHARIELNKISTSGSRESKADAELVIGLLEFYENQKQ